MSTSRTLSGLIVCCLGWTDLARADAVVDWSLIASQAIGTAVSAGRPVPATGLDFAMVHVAVHDAIQAIEGRFKPYCVVIPGAFGSTAAATARAAHDVLVARFPSQAASLDTAYHDYLASHGLSENDPGVKVGQLAAAGIVALRANDGSFPMNPPPAFVGDTDPGVWRPTPSYLPGPPPSFAPMAIPWLGTVTPFTMNRPSQFRSAPPQPLTSRQYVWDYDEVKDLGSFSSTTRTAEQTDLAYFWAENFFIQWNRAVRAIADAHVHDISDSGRLFALVNLAIADAPIAAWDSKSFYVFWRPVTAIQEGDNDGNPRTDGDSTWQPLINTPNYPDLTSGANAVTGAVTRTLQLYFGTDEMTFSVTSTHPLAVLKTRTYTSFSDAAQEVVDARVFTRASTSASVTRRGARRAGGWPGGPSDIFCGPSTIGIVAAMTMRRMTIVERSAGRVTDGTPRAT
jgi:hypothetical protein